MIERIAPPKIVRRPWRAPPVHHVAGGIGFEIERLHLAALVGLTELEATVDVREQVVRDRGERRASVGFGARHFPP